MEQRQRGLTSQQRTDLWRRWKQGQSLTEIGAALSKGTGTVYWVLQRDGGIAPRHRSRAVQQLSAAEREEISRGLLLGQSIRQIASRLERAASTISREVSRNAGRQAYRAGAAERRAWEQAKRPKACLLAGNERLRNEVARKLQADWSPQQIAAWLRQAHHNEPAMRVSHETIYRSLFVQARGVLKKELLSHLRSRRKMRHTQTSTSRKQGQIIDAISIRQRPAEAADRAVPGHWEGDLLEGSRNTFIATLVERHSRYTLLARVDGKDSAGVVNALIAQVRKLPTHLISTLTWDRGCELAQHKRFTIATDVQVYFCDPRSPWQRGTNENTNGLLRQYFPKGTDLSGYTQHQLNAVAKKLNARPRQTLGWRTPADTLAACVALTG
jgi:IS30 family transposase